jgi:hypothetical protein
MDTNSIRRADNHPAQHVEIRFSEKAIQLLTDEEFKEIRSHVKKLNAAVRDRLKETEK